MVFSRTWNASYEAIPSDTDNASEGAERIRDLKTDVRERLDAEHYGGISEGADQGVHKFPVGNTAARASAKLGRLHLNSELKTIDFYDGAAWQVVGIPKATRMLFQQTAAPVGWTKDVTANLDDTGLRIVTGTVGSKTDGVAFATMFATGKVSGSTNPGNTNSTVVTINNTNLALAIANTDLNLSVSGHALTVAELPSHSHLSPMLPRFTSLNQTYKIHNSQTPLNEATSSARVGASSGGATDGRVPYTSKTGSGSTHTHSMGGTTGNHLHSMTGTIGNHAHVADGHIHSMGTHTHTQAMDVNRHDVIIATKD